MRAVSIVTIVCRLIFAAAFVLAGIGKMADAAGFTAVISHYQILPVKMIYGAALILPAVELVGGLALFCDVLVKGTLVVLNILMVVFLAAMGLAMVRGLDVTCGCFGGAGQAVNRQTLTRDAVLLVVGLIAAWGAFRRGSAPDPWQGSALHPPKG